MCRARAPWLVALPLLASAACGGLMQQRPSTLPVTAQSSAAERAAHQRAQVRYVGTLMFATAYAPGLVVGLLALSNVSAWEYAPWAVPLAGPLIAFVEFAGSSDCRALSEMCRIEMTLLGVDFIAQAVGLAMAYAAAEPSEPAQSPSRAQTPRLTRASRIDWRVLPGSSVTPVGLTFHLAF